MGVLRRLDLFAGVAPEAQRKTLAGSLVSLLSLAVLAMVVGLEWRAYRDQRLNTRIFVMNLDSYETNFEFDIELLRTGCEHVEVGLATAYPKYRVSKQPAGAGCRLRGKGYIRSLDTELIIAPSDLAAFLQLFGQGELASMDLSHRIHAFKLGLSTQAVAELSRRFPQVRVTPLAGLEATEPPAQGHHSVFYYEVSILVARVGDAHNVLYTYTRNAVETWGSNVFLKFNLDFSPIAIDYEEGREGFGEFATYVCGVVGGVLSLLRLAYNVLGAVAVRRRPGLAGAEDIPLR